ncbi:MAG: hypothetical protein H7Y18_06275 [Clostridiaceae bacterium]|nr:hypothetical protein [Clostridiaceae bacterium]
MNNKVISATTMDGEEMLKIIEAKSTKGNFQLIYTRRPNAYESYLRESDRVNIGLIKDKNGKIAMQTTCIGKDYYINGKKTTIGYVGGVRKREDYEGFFNWKDLSDFVKASNYDMYYCSFLTSNDSSIEIFTKKRKNFPQLFPVDEYTTYIINPKVFNKEKKPMNSKYNFRCIEEVDLERVYAFLNKEGSKYNFAPVVEDLEKQFTDLLLKDCFILEDEGEILAFGALWNQTGYKQYIVTKYTGFLKILSKFSRITEKLGYIAIPKENEIMDFPILSLFFSKDHNPDYYNCFLSKISEVIKENYKMFVIGINNKDPNNQVYKKLRSIKFKSNIYFVRYDKDITLDEGKNIHIECGFL